MRPAGLWMSQEEVVVAVTWGFSNSPHKVICTGLDVHFKLCVIRDLVFFWLYSLVLELLEACIGVAFLQRRFVLPSACYLKAPPGTTLSYFQPLKFFWPHSWHEWKTKHLWGWVVVTGPQGRYFPLSLSFAKMKTGRFLCCPCWYVEFISS